MGLAIFLLEIERLQNKIEPMTNKPLLTPLPTDEWDESIQHIAERLGEPLNIHKIIAHNPVLMQAYTPLRYHVVRDSTLTGRQREILILRVAHLLQSEYEWSHHVRRGQAEGLSLKEIEMVREGSQLSHWSADEKFILELVDQMFALQELTQETASGILDTVGKKGLIDAVFTVSVYFGLGSLLKTFDVPID